MMEDVFTKACNPGNLILTILILLYSEFKLSLKGVKADENKLLYNPNYKKGMLPKM